MDQQSSGLFVLYYKVVERFGPEAGEKWKTYLDWIGLKLDRFDSVDSSLRPDLFEPETEDDWSNCVNENFKLNLITNLNYALKTLGQHQNSVLLGVEIELDESYVAQHGLLGFDIIDGYSGISLITNWGGVGREFINDHVRPNGLIGDLAKALEICDFLRRTYPKDSHAAECEVWAVYGGFSSGA